MQSGRKALKLAIMQPYFFPYAGYFGLVGSADKFVFYDDVNFIKNGWINRNRLYLSGDVRYFTVPLSGASSNLKINEVNIQPKNIWQRKLVDTIKQSYSKAPYFKQTLDLIEDVLSLESEHISDYARQSVVKTAERLALDVDFVESSSVYGNKDLSSVSRVIDICLKERAREYLNLPGGKELYSATDFSRHDIRLEFVDTKLKRYTQFDREFVPGLSIIDVLMFNSFDASKEIIIETEK